MTEPLIAVVIPSYKTSRHILDVIRGIGPEVGLVVVVDDQCPEGSGKLVEEQCRDPRVRVIYNARNLGVGGAVMAGYEQAINSGAMVIVKMDGDGQMDPTILPGLIAPILEGQADYTKGNRFFDLRGVVAMPLIRLFGNAVLSFLAKFSTGYWDIFDPTNGYTAIHAEIARRLPVNKISQRYFFETDILFRLNSFRAVVMDVPMDAKYGEEYSSLKISRVIGEFLFKHLRNLTKRIFYNYYLRDFSLGSILLPLGIASVVFGVTYGGFHWYWASKAGLTTPLGTVMVATLPIIMGSQFLLTFLGQDIASVPRLPLHRRLVAGKSRTKDEP